MTTPQWLESEAQRVRRERWQARIEGAIGLAVAIVWGLILIEAARGLIH